MKKLFQMSLVLLSMTLLGACTNQQEIQSSNQSLTIVTSFYPMYDFTQNVVGDKGDVSVLTSAGVEPHDYEPSAKDMAKIQNADVFIYQSSDMETWVPKVLESIDTSKVRVIEASEGISFIEHETTEEHEEHEESHNHEIDPHVWLDPVLAKQEVQTIAKGLAEIDENNKTTYEKNAAMYSQKLDELNQAYEDMTNGAKNRTFVTQHTAFAYLAKRYQLNQVAISGISPDQEPTPKELKTIEDTVKKENIQIIYAESAASSKVAETVRSAKGATISELNTLESLTKDQIASGEDYISVMYQNLEHLKLSIK